MAEAAYLAALAAARAKLDPARPAKFRPLHTEAARKLTAREADLTQAIDEHALTEAL